MIKLVAFDWNGTLISDTSAVLKAENKALLAIGAKPISLAKFQKHFQIPIMKYWESLGFSKRYIETHFQAIENVFHPNYELNADKVHSRVGVRNVLKWLAKEKILCIIFSNHHIPGIQKHLIRLKIDNFFDSILARENGLDDSQVYKRSKEKKLFEYIKKFKIKPSEVISVGDSEEEIEIAKKYGYHSVAITGGWNSTARLKKHKPDFLIHNMKELTEIVKKLNNKNNI